MLTQGTAGWSAQLLVIYYSSVYSLLSFLPDSWFLGEFETGLELKWATPLESSLRREETHLLQTQQLHCHSLGPKGSTLRGVLGFFLL